MMEGLIGASVPRADARAKVTGEACYPADLIQRDMLHLQVVFAHRVHARILSLDTQAALGCPGVVAVLTADDVPSNGYGLIERDQPVLCADVVRFFGDKVALVAATSREAAQAGAALVRVHYEDLPAITDPGGALSPDAPLVHPRLGTNLLAHIPLRKGDVAAAFAQADVVLTETFTTTWQEHAYLQPEAGVAYLDEQGRLVIETAGQWIHEDRRQLAQILGLTEEQIVVRYATIGGAFGGREDLSIQPLLALATWKLRRPTALVWTRTESLIGHHKRHPFSIQCRWAARHDGSITAVEAQLLADGGAYASTSAEVVKVATLFATGCYEIPNLAIDGYAVYTNNIPCGAFRGFGAPQAQFASEVMVSRLAEALSMDPIEIRRRNLYREGSLEPTGTPLPRGVSAVAVFERCVEEVERMKLNAPQPVVASYVRRGVGIACGIKNIGYSFGYPEQATATVSVRGAAELESAEVRIGAADVGQGSHIAFRQIAAETLNLPLSRISFLSDASDLVPNAGSASASRLTLMGGRAVRDAALAARQAWSYTDDEQATATVQYRPPATIPLGTGDEQGKPNYCYSYSAQAVEVEVNLLTGQVQVLRVISVHDVGKAINLQQVEGQIEGGIAQALGYALLEDFSLRSGRPVTDNFTTYLLPGICDMPIEVIPIILEMADENGPFGARGVAEAPLVPLTGALACAIHEAVGAWLTQQPMSPERILEAVQKSRRDSGRRVEANPP